MSVSVLIHTTDWTRKSRQQPPLFLCDLANARLAMLRLKEFHPAYKAFYPSYHQLSLPPLEYALGARKGSREVPGSMQAPAHECRPGLGRILRCHRPRLLCKLFILLWFCDLR
jgi:hypothetical protein